jgi:hypothetical protein
MSTTTDKILNFLKDTKFQRKLFHGLDEQDVLDKFAELDGLYQAAISERVAVLNNKIEKGQDELARKEREIEELARQTKKLTLRVGELSDRNRYLEQEPAHDMQAEQENIRLRKERNDLQARYDAAMARLQELEQAKTPEPAGQAVSPYAGKEAIQELLLLKTRLMEEARQEKEAVLASAREEAREIISRAYQESESMKIEGLLESSRLQKQQNTMTEDWNRRKQGLKDELQQVLDHYLELLQEPEEDGDAVENAKEPVTYAVFGQIGS